MVAIATSIKCCHLILTCFCCMCKQHPSCVPIRHKFCVQKIFGGWGTFSLQMNYGWANWLSFIFRSGSVKHHWIEIFSFVESLAEKFIRWGRNIRRFCCQLLLVSKFPHPLYMWILSFVVTLTMLYPAFASQSHASYVLHCLFLTRDHSYEVDWRQVSIFFNIEYREQWDTEMFRTLNNLAELAISWKKKIYFWTEH